MKPSASPPGLTCCRLLITLLLVLLFSGQSRAAGIGATLYETNFKANSVQAFTLDGASLGFFGSPVSPTGIAVDSTGNIYVANDKASGYVIQKYTRDGQASIFADTGLNAPHGIAFDKAGNLFVANGVGDTIEKFTPDGVGTVFADASDGIAQPTDLLFDDDGNLFVTNAYGGWTGTGSVQKYTSAGAGTLFAEGVFNTAYGLAMDRAGAIYVSNFVGDNVLKFAPDGTYLGVFVSAPLDGPHGMVFDSLGNLYVANNVKSTIEKFSATGAYLGVFAYTGSGPHFLALAPQPPVPTPTPTPAPPTIVTQPSNRVVVLGATANFKVVAQGSDPLTYQWRRNGVIISHATHDSYTTPPTMAGDSGSLFSVLVQNDLGSVVSNTATLTVKTPPIITQQPADAIVKPSESATFTVVATGMAPLTYQWRKNGVEIAGATKASYTTPHTVPADGGSLFSVFITNVLGSATSNDARLTVLSFSGG